MDHARGIGIVLVVVGHVLGGLEASRILHDSATTRTTIAWMYAFHMPLFFFLAGLFAANHARGTFSTFLAAKLRTIAYPYFVWSVLQSLLSAASAPVANHQVGMADLLHLLDTPIMQFWFLYVLFCISVIFWLARRVGVGPTVFLCFAAALYVTGNVGNLGSWGPAYGIARHLIYFALGVTAAPFLLDQFTKVPGRHRYGLGAIAAAILTVAVWFDAQRSWWIAPLVAYSGIIASLGLASLTCRSRRLGFLGTLGERSLQIYVAHTIAAAGCRVVLQHGLGVHDPGLHLAAGVLTGVIGPLALVEFCDRLGIRWAFTWPPRRPRRIDPLAAEPVRAAALPGLSLRS